MLRVSSDRQVGWGALQRGPRAWFLCAQPCRVPAQVSSVSWEEPDHESPGGCWVPAQVSSISWEGSDHESPVGWEEHVNERPLYAASTELLSDFPVGGAGVR